MRIARRQYRKIDQFACFAYAATMAALGSWPVARTRELSVGALMFGRLASLVCGTLALILLSCVNAQAVTRSFVDSRGDVWTLGDTPNRRVPDRDQGDILRTTLRHGVQQILVRTRFAELNREGRRIVVYTRLRTNTGLVRGLSLSAGPDRWSGRTNLEPGPIGDCKISHTLNYATNTAIVRLPRTCLDNPRTVQARFGVATVAAGQTFADNPVNGRDTESLPPYTAPVRVG